MGTKVLVRIEDGKHDFPYLLPRVPCVGETISLMTPARNLHDTQQQEFVVSDVNFTLTNDPGSHRGADPESGRGDVVITLKPKTTSLSRSDLP